MAQHITIDYRPRHWAAPFHQSFCRFAALVLHRRAGKTTALINHHQRAALDDDWERRRLQSLQPQLTDESLQPLLVGRHYGHILPYRNQAKLVAWDMLKRYARDVPGAKANESELLIKYPTGHKVQLFGADDPDSLRGPAFSGLSFDEFDQQPPNIYSEVLSKALGDHLGYAIFAGTLKGKQHLYRTYEAAKGDPEWFALWQDIDTSLATEDDVAVTLLRRAMEDDRKQILKGLMAQSEFDQEWFLSPEAAIKGAVYAKELQALRTDGRITTVPYDPVLPVDTYWDLGIGDAMSIWFVQSLKTGEVRVIDYYECTGMGFPHYVQILRERGYTYGKHIAPHDIQVRELGSGRSRLETAGTLGLKFQVAPRLSLEDGIHAGRMLLPRCWFDRQKTEVGVESLLHYRWDYNTRLNELKPVPVHDHYSHGADAFRMLAVSQQPPKPVVAQRDPFDRGGAWEHSDVGWMAAPAMSADRMVL